MVAELTTGGRPIRAGGRPGRTDPRGNSYTRRARKNWMLTSPQFERTPGTEGHEVMCTHCKTPLTFDTVEADRKVPGGPYARHNVQPACRNCNLQRSNNPTWKGPYTP
jgi:5-methylcytosine-specific restriction endonuclease McrA